ncbi:MULTISPECIES: ABC transporter ATP-binding protein [Candidatus Microthrix]|jgi:branched-chain amino acid transport system ATP-binding protein|uniref:Leucine/isoleucine/valine transporter subunit ATP-binding component of ABC superfamily n=1 Tax=Candidatus Neomicrothrix parvicella RN1 TaxID=1229780 RepID=R4YWQ0_9ACTN|nr:MULTISPECIES: ABC transporter ATP-binding protein [Microthrix]NLH64758.1 ABC transporter ATP-binding protein [Candidatus Microthrix parvicella]MBK7018759.1 ABC transporter ATP-binding protein [Candidatus Microthrix sp.]MBK7321441.1 ABC transporter ATP-binding protein [Candidatus Microthrix sp.]MBL0205655.1 ABC transporter ATP-binding protein [Candidatus Microthrix sp.]MBP6135699.1 ABC transporter ATP-binding protein [Candidatus Microthrix sp.]
MSDGPLVELRGVHAGYDGIDVLHGVDLVVGAGEVVAILGPNGAGKSTTLKVLAGLLPASAGDIIIAGRRVNGARADDLARRGLCLIPEGRGIFPNLTVRENLWMMTHRGQDRAQIEERSLARFPQLAQRIDQTSGTLSGGQQQMLAMARGLATDPALLVLDELSMGLAPIIVDELYDTVAQVAAEGTSVLLVEQFARIVIDVADVAVVLVQGHVVDAGRPHDIEDRLSQAYLGG